MTMSKLKDHAWYRWDGGWYENDGENTRYCVWDGLGAGAVVFDIGSYEGEWINRMVDKYPGYQYYGFEPAPRAFEVARERLAGCENVSLYNFGLGVTTGRFRLYNSQQDAATFLQIGGAGIDAEMINVREFLESEDIKCVDLAVINVEGGEFELLPYLIASNLIRRFKRLMIQWHYVVPEAGRIREAIMSALAKTHAMTWNHGTWEAWNLQCPE